MIKKKILKIRRLLASLSCPVGFLHMDGRFASIFLKSQIILGSRLMTLLLVLFVCEPLLIENKQTKKTYKKYK